MNAVTIINDVPHFELAADELILRDEQYDSRKPIYFHMRPAVTRDIKQALSEIREKSRPSGKDSVVVESVDLSAFRSIFDKNFIRLTNVRMKDGTEVTVEQCRAWLDRNSALKMRVASECYATVFIGHVPPALTESDADLEERELEISLEDAESTVLNRYRLYSPEAGQTVEIKLTHAFRKESESDRLVYGRSRKQEFVRKTGEMSQVVNYDTIEQLYNRLIVRVDGALLSGQQCTEDNKEAWVSLIPLWLKKVSIDQLFDENALKNV